MTSLLRQGLRALAQPLCTSCGAINTPIRYMSVDGVKSFHDRETAAEVCHPAHGHVDVHYVTYEPRLPVR